MLDYPLHTAGFTEQGDLQAMMPPQHPSVLENLLSG